MELQFSLKFLNLRINLGTSVLYNENRKLNLNLIFKIFLIELKWGAKMHE